MEPRDRLIVALDVEDAAQAEALVARLGPAVRRVKVGLELFTAEGPEIVRRLRGRGLDVMLDLKLHDIPETVGRAVARAAALGAGLLTVHTAGGRAMIEAAAAARRRAGSAMRLLGITVLTSMAERDLVETGCEGDLDELVLRRAQLALEFGLDGVVASPLEAAALRRGLPDALIVTPGVRPAGAAVGDQVRIATPAAALGAGADAVVVGRPIRDAADPRAAAEAIVAELASVG